MNNDYEFFWGGIYSNWYESPITVDGMEFNCVEQFMMFKKAETFNDLISMADVMATPLPNEQKAIGRKVKNYNDAKWAEVRYEAVKPGVRAKFTQHENLKEELLATGKKHIVEASPYDVVWGIGMGENDPDRFDESKWRGDNLLGKCIMDVRDDLQSQLEITESMKLGA